MLMFTEYENFWRSYWLENCRKKNYSNIFSEIVIWMKWTNHSDKSHKWTNIYIWCQFLNKIKDSNDW